MRDKGEKNTDLFWLTLGASGKIETNQIMVVRYARTIIRRSKVMFPCPSALTVLKVARRLVVLHLALVALLIFSGELVPLRSLAIG